MTSSGRGGRQDQLGPIAFWERWIGMVNDAHTGDHTAALEPAGQGPVDHIYSVQSLRDSVREEF